MSVKSFRELIAWQKAMDLVAEVYAATVNFPSDERFGLTSQLRRAAVSIPSNIAEGQGRNTPRDFVHFLSIAYGSLCEVQTQVLLSQRLQYMDTFSAEQIMEHSEEVGRILNGLSNSLIAKRT